MLHLGAMLPTIRQYSIDITLGTGLSVSMHDRSSDSLKLGSRVWMYNLF